MTERRAVKVQVISEDLGRFTHDVFHPMSPEEARGLLPAGCELLCIETDHHARTWWLLVGHPEMPESAPGDRYPRMTWPELLRWDRQRRRPKEVAPGSALFRTFEVTWE